MRKERIALVIKPNGDVEVHRGFKEFNLEQLQGWVGGYIEGVKGRYEGKIYQMWVNEEGLLNNLPFNWAASALANDCNPNARMGFPTYLAGTVVLCMASIPKNSMLNDPKIVGFNFEEVANV